MMNKNTVSKGVVYLYVEGITMLFSGYLYWLILSKLIDPSSIGLASTIIALATIVFSFASVGVAGGVQRYIAKSLADNRFEHVQSMINSSLLITTLGVFISGIILLFFRDSIGTYFDISFDYTLLSVALFIILVFADLLRAIIIPSLKVKIIAIASVISTAIKFFITFALVFLDYGVYGIIFGFLAYSTLSSLIFTFAIKKNFYKAVPNLNRFMATKDILVASTTFWIPSIITTVGSQLGTITVFLAAGSGNAGVYFISFSIVTGIMVIASVLSSIAYPTISALKDGKKRATWRLIKISLLLTIPISNILMFYPEDILSLFGSAYATGASTLQILSLSSLPTCIATAIGVLFYSYGNNGKFLVLGLVTSIPRVMLYFLFVPTLGGDGAALSYLIGSIAGAFISLLYAQKINMSVSYRQIVTLFMVPIIIAIPLEFFDFNSIVSIFIILILSYLVFIILKLVDSQDIGDLRKILPNKLERFITSILHIKLKAEKEK